MCVAVVPVHRVVFLLFFAGKLQLLLLRRAPAGRRRLLQDTRHHSTVRHTQRQTGKHF